MTWTRLVRDVITYVQNEVHHMRLGIVREPAVLCMQTGRISSSKLKNKDDALRKVAVTLRRIIKLADARALFAP